MSELRIVSWNVAGGALRTRDGEDVPEAEAGRYIGSVIRETDADMVVLQEVLFMDREREVSQVPEIAAVAGFRHYYTRALSPSHLHGDPYGIGLTILSHQALESPSLHFVPNPGITHENDNGTILQSHDKGYLLATITVNGVRVRLANVHFLPYHDFDRDPAEASFREIWRLIDDTLVQWATIPTIVAGDFNAWPLDDLLPRAWPLFRPALDGPTRPDGTRPDQVLLSTHCALAGSEIRESASDHHLCIVDTRLTIPGEEQR